MKLFGPSEAEDTKRAAAVDLDAVPNEVSTVPSARALPYWATSSHHGRANLPWSMNLMRMCCKECGSDWPPPQGVAAAGPGGAASKSSNNLTDLGQDEDDEDDIDVKERYTQIYANWKKKKNATTDTTEAVSIHVVAPMLLPRVYCTPTIETLLQDYFHSCRLYSTKPNSGVMATLRFSLPAMRVAGPFHDADMLSLGEFLIRHCNTSLTHVRRLDFSRASKEGKLHGISGFRSHGALVLAKVLTLSQHIQEVRLQRHRIGPYGAAALFLAASHNQILQTLVLRRCQIGERGGLAFAEIMCSSKTSGLQEIDLSANRIGFRGCLAIEKALQERGPDHPCLSVDLEGNLVLQEVMNGVTHGMGILLAILGSILMYNRVHNAPLGHFMACTVYSASLLLLYTSSTLYHSFFTLQHTKYIFEVLDKCAIYILIAGSYTPFLQIVLGHVPRWSVYLLAFIWSCGLCGIYVQLTMPDWKHKKIFSLLMYVGMGWACVVCLPELSPLLPPAATHLLIMGGVGYTSGIPFFIRNNNLDHSIWHLFVLTGSLFHWLCIYWYVIPGSGELASSCAAEVSQV